jgi:exopolyphosphatase/guanosine-5'-triphosphate,3'-diphosphate pyrophosphatase
MRLAAIDIGSNAVRLIVKEISGIPGSLKISKVAHTRVPIRLGEDVFSTGSILSEKEERLAHALRAFAFLIQAMQVKGYRACATSAMREAANGEDIVERLRASTGVGVELIDGQTEADLIFSNFEVSLFDRDRDYLYIDVGGGSTELTLIRKGERVAGRSFKVGAVRLLENKVDAAVWGKMESWCQDLAAKHGVGAPMAIGAGGNINRLFKLGGCLSGAELAYEKLASIVAVLERCSYEERMSKFQLKPDRADVVVPAGRIYLRAMEMVGAKGMLVPKVGLADGIILGLYASLVKAG